MINAAYANYDTGYDFSALMGGTVNSSGNLLSDYASIKNGSYGKLLKDKGLGTSSKPANSKEDKKTKNKLPFRNCVPNENEAINIHCGWLVNILLSNI